MSKCNRLLVKAFGVDRNGECAYAENENFTVKGCTGEAGKCGCTHAEINLLKKLSNPYYVFVSHSPCLNCAIALDKAGVSVVEYFHEYRIKDGIEFLRSKGILIKQMLR